MKVNQVKCDVCDGTGKVKEKRRTQSQNRALHVFFKELADELNQQGLDQRVVLKPTYDMRWNSTSVKEYLWKPVQKALYAKESTTELSKHEQITEIHDMLMKALGEKFGIEYQPFPDVHSIGAHCGKKTCNICDKE